MAETTYYQSRHTGEEIDNILDEAITATVAANEAAKKANDESAKIPGMVAGKADLDPNTGYVKASQIDPLQGRQTGVNTSNGYFSSADDSLLFYGERSYEICFTTGSIGSSICRLFSDSLDGTCSAAWAENGNLYVKFLGSSHTLVKELSDNTFYQLIINKDHVSINGIKILTSSPGTAQPSNIAIGSYGDATHMFNGVIHRFRIFNYYLTDSDEEILWNNGNPMAGSWPMMQNIPFPGDRYTESSMTFFPNNPNVSTSFQLDVAQANGFSGKFMRFDAITTLSIYTSTHEIISPVVTNRVRYNIEYRGFGPFFYGTASNPGNTVDTALPDNTGDAKKYAMVLDATKTNFVITDSNDSPDSWLEIRVNSIEVAGCVAEYLPCGLLADKWRDTAGNGLDMAASSPLDLSYESVQDQRETVVDSGLFFTNIAYGTAAKSISIPDGYIVSQLFVFNNNSGNLTGVSASLNGTSLISNQSVTTASPLFVVPSVVVSYKKSGNTISVNATGNTTNGGMRIKAICKWIGF